MKNQLKFEVRLEVVWPKMGALFTALEAAQIDPTHVVRIFDQDTQEEPAKPAKPPVRDTPAGRVVLKLLAKREHWRAKEIGEQLYEHTDYMPSTGPSVLSRMVREGDAWRSQGDYRISEQGMRNLSAMTESEGKETITNE